MPFPEYYKTVISRSLERNVHAGLNSMEFAELILRALDTADDLLGSTAPVRPANILIKTPDNQATAKIDLSKALLIGTPPSNQLNAEIVEEAPPMAMVRNPDGIVQGESEEEIEAKKAQLHSWILANLPRALTLRLPGFEKDIQLNLYVRPGPPKMSFIRVFYTQFAEEEDGPQLQLSTSASDVDLDVARIKAEIVQQAQSRYRKDKTRIEPSIPPPNPMPDLEAAFRNARYDPESDKVSQDDRDQWNRVAGRTII